MEEFPWLWCQQNRCQMFSKSGGCIWFFGKILRQALIRWTSLFQRQFDALISCLCFHSVWYCEQSVRYLVLLQSQKPWSLFQDERGRSEIFIKVFGEYIQSTSLMSLHNRSLLVGSCLPTHSIPFHTETNPEYNSCTDFNMYTCVCITHVCVWTLGSKATVIHVAWRET